MDAILAFAMANRHVGGRFPKQPIPRAWVFRDAAWRSWDDIWADASNPTFDPECERAIFVIDDNSPIPGGLLRIAPSTGARLGLIIHVGTVGRSLPAISNELKWEQCVELAELRHEDKDPTYAAVRDLLAGELSPQQFWDFWSPIGRLSLLNDLAIRIELQLLHPVALEAFNEGEDDIEGFETIAAQLPFDLQKRIPQFDAEPIPLESLLNALDVIRAEARALQPV